MGCCAGHRHAGGGLRSHIGPPAPALFLFKSICVLLSLDAAGVAAQHSSEGSLKRSSPSNLVRREALARVMGDAEALVERDSGQRHNRNRRSGGRFVEDGVELRSHMQTDHAASKAVKRSAARSKTRDDDHVIDNYGNSASMSRMVNEKTSCQGACTDGWDDNMLDTLDDGTKVHGMFTGTTGSPTSITKTFTTNTTHVMVRVSMIFWSIGHWDNGENGFLKINGVEEWSKSRASATDCQDWSLCGKTFNNASSPRCCQVVSKTINHASNAALVEIGSNIDEVNGNESFGVSDFIFDVISHKSSI